MATAHPHPASILTHFAALPDPRRPRRRLHRLLDLIAIAICAVIAGCDDWVEVAAYGRKKRAWLQTFLPLPHGIPSHDTFSRVFRLLEPRAFQRCFTRWIAAVQAATAGKLVAIDGKTLRHSFDTAAGQSALHLVSAWAGQNRLVLAQRAVDGHSNEITAIPELVRLLDLKGAVVTIDAMGCQKEIVATLRDQGADYVITAKANQGTLYEDLSTFFQQCLEDDFAGVPHRYQKTVDHHHGRHEWRHYYVVDVPESLRARHAWRDLRSVGMVYAERQAGDGEVSGETRFFISSLPAEVKAFARAVRGHWGIENGLHWVLDMAFGEDASRVRKDHGPENLAWLRRVALSLLRNEPTKASVKCKRKMAGWDNDYLLQILLGNSGGS
jgi:predicted transposase YbfD/YdcC